MEMKSKTRTTLALLIVLGLSGSAFAGQTIYVDDDGPADFNNIQAAIDDSSDGDTIIVADGTYTGNGNREISFLGKAITVRSENGPENCIIDCQGKGRGFLYRDGEDANSILVGLTITNGYASTGGALYISSDSSPVIINCKFENNHAVGVGGAISCYSYDSPKLTNCIVTGNSSLRSGGGIFISEGSPILTNCKFSGNSAVDWGGAVHCEETSSPTIRNCLIIGNKTEWRGGGISITDGSDAIIENCTISDNIANDKGGGIYCPDRMTVSNSILWGSSPDQIYYDPYGISVNHSDVQGGWPGGNIDVDPLFVEPGYWDANGLWVEGDYHLLPYSPCIDAGDPSYIAEPNETDLDGKPRIFNGIVDMGAYEFPAPRQLRELYVDDDAAGANNGSSWADAYNYLQDALPFACRGDEIHVAQGIYIPDRNSANPNGSGDRMATFRLNNGVTIKGGYAGFGAPDANARDFELYETVLSGDLNGDDGPNFTNNTDNSNCVMTSLGTDQTTVLDGFTITAANAYDFRGGGMYNGFCRSTIKNCVFSGNSSEVEVSAGGMHNYSSELSISNCTFNGNRHKGSGGGMWNEGDNSILTDCTFNRNSAYLGGGLYNTFSAPTLTNCTFSGNSAQDGGGMFNYGSSPTLSNCTFAKNVAIHGNAMACDSYNQNWPSSPHVTNCILWDGGNEIWNNDNSTITITYSDVQGGWQGEGNIDADPCFVDPGYWDPNGTPADANDDFWIDGDYHLLLDSPCVDTGDNTAVPPSVLTDLDGNPRIIGDTVDMGVYEFCGPIYVDDDGPNDPGPDDPQVSDPLENGTEAHPFDTIQEAIDLAEDGYTVLVRQGSYFEPAGGSTIDFLGKNITLTSTDPTDWDIVDNTIIRGYVQFSGTEDPNCMFAGFKIRNFEGAIYGNHTHATISHCNISGNGPCGATVIKDCDGTISNCLITDNLTFFYCGVYPVVFGCNGLIKNCTIANNISGVSVGTATIKNCIIYNNAGSQLDVGGPETLNISYCNLQGGLEGITGGGSINRGPGNIDTDPCFVRAGYWEGDPLELIEGDYHLRSEGWRWNTEGKSWTYDYITSRCIDAGNPGSPLDSELMSVPRDPDNVWGVNLRINMGAFGGTGQAGMPPYDWALPADLNNDGIVNYLDFAYQALDWQATAPEQPGDQNRDGVVNKMDLARLANDWLKKTTFYIPEPDVPDVTPPAPVPAIITIGAISPSSISMISSEAFDESGVQYYFQATTAGAHDSGWQNEPNYTDVNLVPDTTYCYRVKARDKSVNSNETIWSPQVCTATPPPPDLLPPLPDPMQWDPVVDTNGYDGRPREVWLDLTGNYGATMRGIDADDVAPLGVAPAEVEYYFECGEPGYTGVWPAGFSSGWRTVALYPDENERRTYTVPISQYGGQAYEFRVWARDASDNQNTTLPSDWYPAIDRLPP